MESWLRKEMATMIGERVADAYILPHQGRYRLASFERGQVKERRSLTLAGGQPIWRSLSTGGHSQAGSVGPVRKGWSTCAYQPWVILRGKNR